MDIPPKVTVSRRDVYMPVNGDRLKTPYRLAEIARKSGKKFVLLEDVECQRHRLLPVLPEVVHAGYMRYWHGPLITRFAYGD